MAEKISIIIPLYNRENLVAKTLDSIKAQTYPFFECVVIDDHSSDGSLSTARKHVKGDDRFLVKQRISSQKGAPACRNEGKQLATGDFIMFLDSDDLLSPTCLETRIDFQRSNDSRDLDFTVHQVAKFRDSLDDIETWSDLSYDDDVSAFLNLQGWHTSSTLFKSDFLAHHNFDESATSWQDWEFHLRILLTNPRYAKASLSEPDVFIYRGHSERISAQNIQFVKIKNLFSLFTNIETEILNSDYASSVAFMDRNWWKFLNQASLHLPAEQFEVLFNFWRIESISSSPYKESRFIYEYLRIQNRFKVVNRLGFFNGLKIKCVNTWRKKKMSR